MSDLRKQLIRLAHANPELRSHLLPILKDAGWQDTKPSNDTSALVGPTNDLEMGETVEYPGSRVRAHRYRDSLQVVDTTNAGKRGKKVDGFTLYNIPEAMTQEVAGAYNTLIGVLTHAQAPFAVLVNLAQNVATQGENEVRSPRIQMTAQRGVDVMPAGFKPIKLNGENVYIEASYKNFMVRDNKDQNNLPTCIPALKGGQKDIPVFYRWVSDNQALIHKMTFSQVLTAMNTLGVNYHQYCAMD